MTDRIALIRERIPLRELVEETVALKRKGRELSGLCPFHMDTKPSLDVNPEKNLWVCRSCQAGGSVIDWIVRRDGLTIADAIKVLSERAGIPTEQMTHAERAALRSELARAAAERDRAAAGARQMAGHVQRARDLLSNTKSEITRLRKLVAQDTKMERADLWDRLASAYASYDVLRYWLDKKEPSVAESYPIDIL